ncbi:MAG: DNA/RNA non-specific endonuclease [Cyanobacteriota bacterium]|nr:DNA/RNA non-specific endonuclease [Cyanobacteriota bacterium]
MSNMIPQAPANNREVWRELEEYSRDLVNQGKELYIVAGGEGKSKAIADGRVTVPKYTWKVILVLDNGNIENTIAVRMPNNDTVARTDWTDYIVSVDEIERKTGYDFFSTVPDRIARKIESKDYTSVIEP